MEHLASDRLSSEKRFVEESEIAECDVQDAEDQKEEEILIDVPSLNKQKSLIPKMSTYTQEPLLSSIMGQDASERYALKLAETGRVISIKNAKYLYVGIVGGWVSLNCPESFKFLAVAIDSDAPVNYTTAAAPLFDKITKLPCHELVIHRSVCFKKRYAILSHCNKITKDLEYVTLDEADYFENMPESLHSKGLGTY
jgi:hypothetical protein